MAETKTTATKAKTTTAKAPAKKTAPKTEAAKTTTAKTAATKSAVKKTTAKAPEKKAVAVKEIAAEVKVETKPAVKVEKKANGPMLKIKLVKSVSGRLEKQQKTIAALGLTKIGSETVKPDNACTRGMIFVVKHLVEVTSVKEN